MKRIVVVFLVSSLLFLTGCGNSMPEIEEDIDGRYVEEESVVENTETYENNTDNLEDSKIEGSVDAPEGNSENEEFNRVGYVVDISSLDSVINLLDVSVSEIKRNEPDFYDKVYNIKNFDNVSYYVLPVFDGGKGVSIYFEDIEDKSKPTYIDILLREYNIYGLKAGVGVEEAESILLGEGFVKHLDQYNATEFIRSYVKDGIEYFLPTKEEGGEIYDLYISYYDKDKYIEPSQLYDIDTLLDRIKELSTMSGDELYIRYGLRYETGDGTFKPYGASSALMLFPIALEEGIYMCYICEEGGTSPVIISFAPVYENILFKKMGLTKWMSFDDAIEKLTGEGYRCTHQYDGECAKYYYVEKDGIVYMLLFYGDELSNDIYVWCLDFYIY